MDPKLTLHFLQVDVFTEQPLGGNPLAVFLNPEGLTDSLMQKIALEMNHSETTFVFPPSLGKADFHVRIFTPWKEIPFAGHPTLGTAEALRIGGRWPLDKEVLTLQMGTGLIRVTWRDGIPFMEQRAPQFGTVFTDIPVLAEALGVSPEVIHVEWPSQVVSTGFPALLVPFRGLPPLKEVEINLPALKQLLGQIPMIYAFCMETADTDCQVHARGFAPLVGIPEDPATGSVAGALGAYVARYGLLPGLEDLDFQIEQGMEIRRPSRLQVKVERQNGEVGSLRVGGPVTRVLEGKMWI